MTGRFIRYNPYQATNGNKTVAFFDYVTEEGILLQMILKKFPANYDLQPQQHPATEKDKANGWRQDYVFNWRWIGKRAPEDLVAKAVRIHLGADKIESLDDAYLKPVEEETVPV